MTSLPERVDVLIVGAGPTGMAAALSLHKHGCTDILIVDGVLAGENTSRAMAVHAATMESLDELGCADKLVELGHKTVRGRLWDGYRFHDFADFGVLKGHTKYPYGLMIPQHVTERVLFDRLLEENICIHRPLKVTSITSDKDDVEFADATFEDGQIVKARYIVGADGARSIVRQSAGITYADPDGEDGTINGQEFKQAVFADVTFVSPPPFEPEELLLVMAHGNFFGCVPLPPSSYEGQQVWRLATGVPTGVPPHAPPTEYLQKLVDAYGPGSIPSSAWPEGSHYSMQIEKTVWSTRFRTHSAIADAVFVRLNNGAGAPIILVGDAAHLHPPAGGQGMNLGIRDAVFLGPVLAEHLKRSTSSADTVLREELDKPLKEWAAWRHEQALQVIALAKGLMSIATWQDKTTWYLGFIPVNWAKLRNFIFWAGGITGTAKKRAPWRLSGLQNR